MITQEESMAENIKHEEYASYAEHCLAMAKIAPEHDSRFVLREMAAEWLRLADTIQPPRLGL
jgi:hypothetical protein